MNITNQWVIISWRTTWNVRVGVLRCNSASLEEEEGRRGKNWVEMNVRTFLGAEGPAGDLCGLLKPPSVLSPPSRRSRLASVRTAGDVIGRAKVESITAARISSQGEKRSTLIKTVCACTFVWVRARVGKNTRGCDVRAFMRGHRGIFPCTHAWHLNVFT